MLLQASKCWAQAGPLGPTEAEAQGAQVLGRGVGRKGRGWPCYCWQEVAPFFPDGETEAQGGLGTCPKSLTVSQLLGRGQLTLGNKVTQTLVTFPLGSEDRQEGLKGPGLPGGEHLAFPRGLWGAKGRSLLGTGQGQVQRGSGEGRGEERGGHSGENSISGKTGIHFKISAQRGQQGCSQTRQGPGACSSSHKPCSPVKGPGRGVPGETPHPLGGKGGRGGAPPHPPQSGVWGVRGRARLSEASPAHPSRPQALSHLCRRGLGTQRGRGRTPGLMRVCSTSETLLRWEKENQVERGPPSPETRGTGGLEVERGWQEGAFRAWGWGGGHRWTVDSLLSGQAGTGSGHGPSHLVMGEKLVSV